MKLEGVCVIISGLEANKMNFKTHCFACKQSQTGLFIYIVLHCNDFNDVNLIISPLDRPVTAEVTKGFPSRPHLSTFFVYKKFK